MTDSDLKIFKKQDNGKEITISVGEIIQIELERYGSTGYEWYLDSSYEQYFKLIREDTEEISHNKYVVGAPVKRKWQLKAVKKGEAEISIYLYRDWEGKDKAIDLFRIRLKIL